MKFWEYMIIYLLVILGLFSYWFYSDIRGCGPLPIFNPDWHEWCECPTKWSDHDLVYTGFNCFSCDHVCATIGNVTEHTT